VPPNLYWGDQSGTGNIKSVNTSTLSAVTTVASNQPAAMWIRARNGSLYWSTYSTIAGIDYGSINSYVIATGVQANVVSTQKGLGAISQPFAVNTTSAFWSLPSYQLWKSALSSGSPTMLVPSAFQSTTLDADDSYVYATEAGLGNVVRFATSTGARTVLASGQSFPFRLLIASGVLYWSDYGAGLPATPGTLMALNLTTGAPTALATNLSYPKEIAVDTTNVYFSQIGNPACAQYGFWRVPISGGTPFLLGCSTSLATNIVVDSAYLYYSDWNYIYRLAK
jgi:hypothetical protein